MRNSIELNEDLLRAISQPDMLGGYLSTNHIDDNVLELDWYGKQLEFPIHYGIAVGREEIAFWAWRYKAAYLTIEAKLGDFVEGLWNQDVVELFVDGEKEGSYTEINLSPQGAWWSRYFIEYRKPCDLQDDKANAPARCYSALEKDAWFVSALFSRRWLFDDGGAEEESRVRSGNVCAITYGPGGVEHYLSLASAPAGVAPDFHRSDLRSMGTVK